MSRKGVTTKRVKTVQTALSRISAQPRSPAGRETIVSARPKSIRPITITTRETLPAVGQAQPHATPRTTMPREPGTSLAAAQPLAYHGRCIRPSRERTSHVRPRNIGQIFTPADRESIRPRPFRLGHDPMSGRSSRPTVPTPRSTRSPF
ncbi:unnamed protein product [Microthlaspi erraticum]|uniref:Uncharacterized protein n=1 Tax=Microthlaspi erraticum TaxID=1685480 RepID=A0A6D2KPG3_9BRAS|nr:unnamed protein product [Microthlaspi erraticum]